MDIAPNNLLEFQDIARLSDPIRIQGTGTKTDFANRVSANNILRTTSYSGIIEWSAEDLVVEVRAGTTIKELQSELATKNQYLPIPDFDEEVGCLLAGIPGTVGGLIATNLPTKWEYATRGPRYWVLGLAIVTGNGEIIKCGSKAVKNVAGYDVQKLHVGALGSLGIIVEATLRLTSIPTKRPVDYLYGELPQYTKFSPMFISRGKRSDIHKDGIWCKETGIHWCSSQLDNCIGRGMISFPKGNQDWLASIKNISDPNCIFNPGIMGVF